MTSINSPLWYYWCFSVNKSLILKYNCKKQGLLIVTTKQQKICNLNIINHTHFSGCLPVSPLQLTAQSSADVTLARHVALFACELYCYKINILLIYCYMRFFFFCFDSLYCLFEVTGGWHDRVSLPAASAQIKPVSQSLSLLHNSPCLNP